MRRRILTAVAAAAIGTAAMTGTASAAEQVEVCETFGQTRICVRALESGAVVGVTICQGIFCFERNVPQPV
ncbi:MAG TPA: hypothetical protein VG318_10440 [Actinomycetota bacterium]|nr:hypothetical protein [Actinomycetota bacterium]